MGVILSPTRIRTMLPGLMCMPTPEPMSMRIHTGIMAPIITPIDRRGGAKNHRGQAHGGPMPKDLQILCST